jgi:hypothetical protein
MTLSNLDSINPDLDWKKTLEISSEKLKGRKFSKEIISELADLDAAAAHKVEVLAQNLPDTGPLETNPAHVVVGDLHQLR